MTKFPESTASFIMTPFDPPKFTEEQVRVGFTDRATFRISPHGNTKEDAKPMTAANKLDTAITGRGSSVVHPIIPTREKSSSTKSAAAEGDSSTTATGVCSLCSAMSPLLCPIHKAHADTPMGPNGELYQNFSEALLIAQEREYIGASRNHKLTLTQRLTLAHRASHVHKMRTGRPLNITAQGALHEDVVEEGYSDDDLQTHAQAGEQALEMAKGKVQTILNRIHITPIKAGALKLEPTPPRNPSSSSESDGRMTPNSINEPSRDPDQCFSMLAPANTNHLLSSNEVAQAAILALDRCNPLPKISIPTRYSSTHGEENTGATSTHFGSHIDEKNMTNRLERRTFDRISISERFDAIATHLALLQSDAVCTKQGSVLVTARSLNQQVNWLCDDLKKQIGEEVMSKRPQIGENIACEYNRVSSQKPDATLQKQKRLESEPLAPSATRYTSWAQPCEKLIEMKAMQKEEAVNFVQSAPRSEPKAEETTSDRKQREKLAKWIEVWKGQELKQHAADHRETHDLALTKLKSQNLDNVFAIMMSDGANLAESTVDSMVKNSMDAQKVEGQRTVGEQQKILDDEIALLKKKKVRQELEREMAENEVKAAEALRQKKQWEQWQKKWDDEREGKGLKNKPKTKSETDEQFWDGGNDIDWDTVFGVTAFIVLGIPLGGTGAMIIWHIFFTVFRRVVLE